MTRSSQCHDTARDNGAFDVGAQTGQVVDAVAVVDAHHVLFDDRPFVEVLGDVMCRCANEFDAAFLGPTIRCRTDERRQERVMNVDQRAAHLVEETRGHDLHIADQYHQVHVATQ
jgi:hypothetical protein